MDASPLNKLPTELRLEIYNFALMDERPVCITHVGADRYSDNGGTIRIQNALPNILALTKTCKLVRAEALPEFFGSNWFHLCVPKPAGPGSFDSYLYESITMLELKVFGDWLASIGKQQAAAIKTLSFDYGSDSAFLYIVERQSDRKEMAAKWWFWMQRTIKDWRNAALSPCCDIRARLRFPFRRHYDFGETVCGVDAGVQAIRAITFDIPETTTDDALRIVESTWAGKKTRFEKHADHGPKECGYSEWGTEFIARLDHGHSLLRAVLLDAR